MQGSGSSCFCDPLRSSAPLCELVRKVVLPITRHTKRAWLYFIRYQQRHEATFQQNADAAADNGSDAAAAAAAAAAADAAADAAAKGSNFSADC